MLNKREKEGFLSWITSSELNNGQLYEQMYEDVLHADKASLFKTVEFWMEKAFEAGIRFTELKKV